ncbi:MAG: beta-galactosidase [Dermatophilaceae bacterium]
MTRIHLGGDYNPEQWPESVWAEDMRLMREAGVDLVTPAVFAWSALEPEDGRFELGWLDRVLDLLAEHGIGADLATATASPPPWLTVTHPEVLPVTADGRRLSPGARQHWCPSSPVYRRYAVRLAGVLAERYAGHPALRMWHVGNEYGCHLSHCWCDVSAEAFRRWLAERYRTVEALNDAWGTAFWSQRYRHFDEVLPPREAPTFRNPHQLLDFDRFSSDELLACFLAEKAVLKRATPDVPVTTNFMGFFRYVDYWSFAEHVDVVSNDSYPDPSDPMAGPDLAADCDLMRSLAGGRPWYLMEQATSAVNWRPRNVPKPAGMMRAWSYQAVARGADAVMFFQWRQSRVGAERFHSGMVPHSGTATRTWREVVGLGRELSALPEVAGTTSPARAAVVLDWTSWRALEQDAMPAATSYVAIVRSWHRALRSRGVLVDFARGDADLGGYDLVVVPALFAASDRQLAEIDAAARAGTTLVVTAQTAVVDERLHVRLDGYLGGLQQTLGLRVEEPAPLAAEADRSSVRLTWAAPVTDAPVTGGIRTAVAHDWCDVVDVDTADVLGAFEGGPAAGRPALTRAARGAGHAWYVATHLRDDDLDDLVAVLLDEAGVEAAPGADRWVDVVRRGGLTFVVNHGSRSVPVPVAGLDVLTGADTDGRELGQYEVAVIRTAN